MVITMIPIYKLVDWIENCRDEWSKCVNWDLPPYFELDPLKIHVMKMAEGNNIMLPKNDLNLLENATQFYCVDQNVKTVKAEEFDIITWFLLNYNPHGISILEKNPEYINWSPLSQNPAAVHLLEKNVDKIDWLMISSNRNAIRIIEQNLDKICWKALSCNPGALDLLKNNRKNIYWPLLSENPAAFELDKKAMLCQMQPIAKELTERIYHPDRVQRIKNDYNYDILEEVYITVDATSI
jgi:hypothetical protein